MGGAEAPGALAPAEAGGVWRQTWAVIDERLGLSALAYPVPRHANSIGYILGGVIAVGMLVLILTGVWLAQFYNPSPDHAHDSVQYIINNAPLGYVMRGIHFWMSTIVMITVLLHMARTFVTGSYRRPREVTWLTGVVLLAVTLGFVFTGTVLKWDQEGYEALSHNLEVGNLLGGLGVWFSAEFTQSVEVLGRLYIAHVAILTVALIVFVALHFLLVKRHGISPLPREADAAIDDGPAPERGGSTFAHHLGRMGLIGLALLVLSLILTLIWVPALGPVPNPKVETTKPPWMFLPLYPFEDWFTVRALLWVPVIIFVGLIAVPFVDRSRYMSPRRRLVFVAIGAAVGLTLLALGIKAQVSPVEPHMLEGVM
jgi:quinol-cytochrome oxidoreductase complex cytochrome b subunit